MVEYLAPQAGISVFLLEETSPGVYDYVLDNGVPRSVVTNVDGTYCFVGLPPGNYGVEFSSDPSNPLTAVSADGSASGNRITDLVVGAGAVEIHQDAFFIDPSGVVYDSETFAPLAGATVTLEHNGQPVPDSWLTLTLGFANGSITGSDGLYAYVHDPAIAPSGIYTLRVERQGYNSSDVYKAVPGALTPTLGGGIQQVVVEATPSESMSKLYYMSFDFTFVPANAASTSNGIIHNHIPLDADLLGSVKADVQAILRDDLAMTLRQTGRRSRPKARYRATALKTAKRLRPVSPAKSAEPCAVGDRSSCRRRADNCSCVRQATRIDICLRDKIGGLKAGRRARKKGRRPRGESKATQRRSHIVRDCGRLDPVDGGRRRELHDRSARRRRRLRPSRAQARASPPTVRRTEVVKAAALSTVPSELLSRPR